MEVIMFIFLCICLLNIAVFFNVTVNGGDVVTYIPIFLSFALIAQRGEEARIELELIKKRLDNLERKIKEEK